MSETTWHTGAPPGIGWWPASVEKNKKAIRWWDGREWSAVAFPHYSAEAAAAMVQFKYWGMYKNPMEWCARWWL
jgi:hypothetical protein